MNYRIVAIIALILVAMALPVSAYTLESYNNLTTGNLLYPNSWDLTFVAIENYTSVGKVVVTSDQIYTPAGVPISGSTTGTLKYGVTPVGNYSATWEWSGVPVTGAGTFVLTLLFEDQIPTGATGEHTLIIDGLDTALAGGFSTPRLYSSGYAPLTGTNPFAAVPEDPASVNNGYTVAFFDSGGFATRAKTYTYSVPPPAAPSEAGYICNFNLAFPYLDNPYNAVCYDASTAYPEITSATWELTQPDTSVFELTNLTMFKTLNTDGWYALNYTACNALGCANSYTATFANVSSDVPPATGIQTYFQAVNGQTNGAIYGANLQLHDDETDTWSNVTADADGTHFITTNSTATIDGYADATGFSSVERLNLAPCATSGTCLYELIMWPDFMLPAPGSGLPGDPGTGNVNLVVIVSDKDSSEGIYMAQVTVSDPSGSTQASYTNDAGTKIFAVSNESTIHVTASKTGYSTVSKTTTTSEFGPDTVRIELTAASGAPTPTPIITDASGAIVPPAVTLTAAEQDQDLMDMIRENAPNLVMLFILFTLMYMLKGLMK